MNCIRRHTTVASAGGRLNTVETYLLGAQQRVAFVMLAGTAPELSSTAARDQALEEGRKLLPAARYVRPFPNLRRLLDGRCTRAFKVW